MAGIPDEYITVPERIAEFREKHPEGSLQPANPTEPFQVVELPSGQVFIAYAAAAYRSPDDPRPGIGVAWEPFPGPTNFTRNSELQNAETSAWGRAIVAVLAADAKKGIATPDEVRARQAEQDRPRCGRCGQEVVGDREVMRRHMVDVHGWVRQPDGTVAPKTSATAGEAPNGASVVEGGTAGTSVPPSTETA